MSFARPLAILCLSLVVCFGCKKEENEKAAGGSGKVDYAKVLIGKWSVDSKASLAAAKLEDDSKAKKDAEDFLSVLKLTLEFEDGGAGSLTMEGLGPKQTIPVKYEIKSTEGKTVMLTVTPEEKPAEDYNFKFTDENTFEWSAVKSDSKGIPGPLKNLILTRAE